LEVVDADGTRAVGDCSAEWRGNLLCMVCGAISLTLGRPHVRKKSGFQPIGMENVQTWLSNLLSYQTIAAMLSPGSLKELTII
jgi:hypothetical protein